MTYNYFEVFAAAEKQLSLRPSTHLYELAGLLRCSQPTIEKAVFRYTKMSFRQFQQMMLLQVAYAHLKQGDSIKSIGLSLGYRWPENYSLRREGLRQASVKNRG